MAAIVANEQGVDKVRAYAEFGLVSHTVVEREPLKVAQLDEPCFEDDEDCNASTCIPSGVAEQEGVRVLE